MRTLEEIRKTNRIKQQRYRQKHKEEYNAYMKKWWAENKNNPNVRKWRKKSLHAYNTSEKHKIADKKYSQTEQGKIVGREITARYAKRHPIKRKRTEQKHYWESGGREKRLQRYQDNKKEINKQNKNWRDTHKGEKRILTIQYRSIKYNAKGSHTLKQWKNLCREYDYRCTDCGKKKKLSEDHIIPLSKGGTNYISNIQPLCGSCNSKKGNKI